VTVGLDLARDFLDAFADIERWLREREGSDLHRTFGEMVRDVGKRDRLVREHESALRAFAALRNAIQHERYQDGLPIATPAPQTVAEIVAIRDRMMSPPTIAALLARRGPVETARPDQGLWKPLRMMGERRFSQAPVYGEDGYLGLLTTNAAARWLSAHVDADGSLVVEQPPVAEVLGWAEEYEVATFVARDASVSHVIDRLSGTQSGGVPAKAAVIATHSGRPSEKPLGMFVVHDLPDLLAVLLGSPSDR
jgi:predicted transcriptional regulator